MGTLDEGYQEKVGTRETQYLENRGSDAGLRSGVFE